jgi:NADPH2:quinone reductase
MTSTSRPASQTTHAIRFHRTGGPEVLEFETIEVGAPGPGEATVRNHAVGVNFIDIYFRTGLYPAPLPSGLGFEGAGVVEAVGEQVSGFVAGDRVAYTQGPLGAYTGLHNIPVGNLVRLPDGISFEEGAAMMLKGLTVQFLFRQTYRLQEGETVLFHAAAGGVGLIACQWAKALGVKLIGTAGSDQKAELALAHGAWATINYSRENVVERVKELTDGAKVPVVYDGVGKDTWEASLDCLRPRGLMVSYGNASGPVTGVALGILAQKGSLYVTRPTGASYHDTPEKMRAAADELFTLVLEKKIAIEIDQRYPLADAAHAHRALAARKTTGSSLLIP